MEKRKFELAIFDLDGTILDTLHDLYTALNITLRMYGMPERTIAEVRAFVGNGGAKLIERSVPKDTTAEARTAVLEDYKVQYAKHCLDTTGPYEGITELVGCLRKAGMRTAVVSNKGDAEVRKLCERFFPGMFDAVAGEREGIRRKPAPDTVNEVLRVLGVERKDAVYIGDSEVDVMTAKNAEMPCLSVTWGFRDIARLEESGATVFAHNAEELKNLLI